MQRDSRSQPNRFEALLGKEFTVRLRITVRQLAVAGAVLLTAAYMAWSAYWYMDQGLYSIKWHTHIVFTGLAFSIPAILFGLLCRLWPSRMTRVLLRSSVIMALTATMLEVALVVTGISKNYMELRSGHYQSPYSQNMGNYYNIRHPNDTVWLRSGEFSYGRVTNSLGHSDREWALEKDSATLRIIALGDSFTEGDGAPADSTYPVQLQKMLIESGIRAEVLNAGTSGSDPLFCYRNLKDRLLTYSPDIVIQTVSSDDMLFDIPLRGGLERFADGELKLASPPPWEPVVAASYVLRELFHLFGLDISRPYGAEKNAGHVTAMGGLLRDVILRQDSLGAEHGFVSIWLVLPMKHETRDMRHVFPFEAWQKQPFPLRASSTAMLLPCYEHTMSIEGDSYSAYFWKIDGHHNSRGYRMMAACTAEQVLMLQDSGTMGISPIFAQP